MLNNKQFAGIFNIEQTSAIKELSDESAATCSGGKDAVTFYACDVYDPLKFCPSTSIGVNNSIRDLGKVNFDNTAEAVEIRSGIWKLWPDEGFKDRNPFDGIQPATLRPGKYSLKDLGLADKVSSIEKLS
jgi:hypothetical protein